MEKGWIAKKLKNLHFTGRKSVALLLDPDKITDESAFRKLVLLAISLKVDFFFMGGSLVTSNNIYRSISLIKSLSHQVPVVLFPGNSIQVVDNADGILFLSLISGRNPEYLIGQQVKAVQQLKASALEIILQFPRRIKDHHLDVQDCAEHCYFGLPETDTPC